jgi:hypothetical protein
MNHAEILGDDTLAWAQQQWGDTDLGDLRRARRAVLLGAALAHRPAASLPAQTQSWKDLKAAYRLLQEPDVTHSGLSRRHWEATRQAAQNSNARVILFIQDTTELDYSQHKRTTGLGRIGDDKGRGFLAHTCLAVNPEPKTPEILGVAQQKVWVRPEQPFVGRETRAQRSARAKESDVWAETLGEIGAAPVGGPVFLSVGDRASDIFSYVRQARAAHWHVLLRVTQNRVIRTVSGERARLLEYVRGVAAQGRQQVTLRGRDGQPKREVELQLAWREVTLCGPQTGPERKAAGIGAWVVRCWTAAEQGPALEWVLVTTVPVASVTAACLVTQWYSRRWLVEEYHKCVKSGCAMEERQLETGEGLMRLLGLLGVVAVRLLQVREVSRSEGERAAVEVVPRELVALLLVQLKMPARAEEVTVGEFWRGVGRLGGHIGRQGDGLPGWQTIWRGWERLQDMAWGYQARL